MQSEQWGFSQLKKLPLWFLPLVCAMDKMVLSVSLALGGRKLFAAEIKQEDRSDDAEWPVLAVVSHRVSVRLTVASLTLQKVTQEVAHLTQTHTVAILSK